MDLAHVLHGLRIINVHVHHADAALLPAATALPVVQVLVHGVRGRGAGAVLTRAAGTLCLLAGR